MKNPLFYLLLSWLLAGTTQTSLRAQSLRQLAADYTTGYQQLHLPELDFDYRRNLQPQPGEATWAQKQAFFAGFRQQLHRVARSPLTLPDRVLYDQLAYETSQQLHRLRLLRHLPPAVRVPPTSAGLTALPHAHAWYAFYVQRATNTQLTPRQLLTFGQQQVRRAQHEIRRLRTQLGYGADSAGFYRWLADPRFALTDTIVILQQYAALARRVRTHLPALFADTLVPGLPIRTWPGATAAMPPAIYLAEQVPPVFAFNFAAGRLNRRALGWSYLHEAIPGHHYQLTRSQVGAPSPLAPLALFYPATVEGWGCYVEYLGKELDVYQTPEAELGHWEWDLVRSARVVLDVGIHAQGWTYAQALAYWHATIPGQDDIAEREIKRVTLWPGQCLSYKVGAARIARLRTRLAQQPSFDIRRFHAAYLALSGLPLAIIEQNLAALY